MHWFENLFNFPRLAFSTTGGTHKFWAIDKSMEAIKMDSSIIICFLSH